MTGEFIVMIDGKLKTFETFEKIPMEFEHLIKFNPVCIDGPHTEEEHCELDSFNDKLQELMKRETK